MARHRILTLLGLTSLVATMVTITHFSTNLSEPAVRLLPQTMLSYNSQQYLNSDKNSLLTNSVDLMKSQLVNKILKVNSQLNDRNKLFSVQSNSLKSSSSQPSLIVNSINSVINKNNSNLILDSNPSLVKNMNSKTSVTVKSTIGSTLNKQLIAENVTKNVNKSESNVDFKIDIKNIIPNLKSDPNLDVDQKSSQTENQNLLESALEMENNEIKAVIKPKLIFNAEDLKTTETLKIDKPNACDVDLGATADLLVIVNSAVNHFEARSAIRQTWGKFAIERGAYLLFLIGSSAEDEVQQKVIAEDAKYGDILQGRYIDNYFNLTLKTISMMKWISERCNKIKYVLKVDDDMFVNMQHITDFSETRTFKKVIIGKLAKKWKPHRNTNNKWYVPAEAFNGTIFPNFATGPAYMLSGDAAKPLYEKSIKLTPMYLEDVYMTGIVAEKASIRRLNHALMKNVHVKVNACNFKKLMTSHKHQPQDIVKLWDLVYNQPQKPCDIPKSGNNNKKSVLASNSAKSAPRPVTPAKTRVAAAG